MDHLSEYCNQILSIFIVPIELIKMSEGVTCFNYDAPCHQPRRNYLNYECCDSDDSTNFVYNTYRKVVDGFEQQVR